MPDPRLTLARDDIAARSLEGIVPAARYADTVPHQALIPSAALRRAPSPTAEQLDQLLYGELFDVLDAADGWAFGQARRDGYVGYVEAKALGEMSTTPTHRIQALRSYGFSAPNIKAAPTGLYSMNALLAAQGQEGRFIKTSAGWFIQEHLAPLDHAEPDYVAVAERFVGTPYQWGGRESLGLDCSGLVQQALYASGRVCPRDSDQQAAMGGPADTLQRGDLVFWRGHVAIMVDDARIIHANSWHMAVAIEPLAEAITRIAGLGGGDPTGFRRL